jgi:FtsP/CotA-like multicopper oxidase with cupredoxin domain
MSGVTTMEPIRSTRARARLAPWVALAVATSVLLAGAGTRPAAAAVEDTGRATGLPCTTDPAGGTHPTFNLTTKAGYINLADGTTAYTWGFSEGTHPFQHPGPILCVTEGDTVTVILKNSFTTTSPKSGPAVSMIFPGQEGVMADGQPSQPQVIGGAVTALAKPAQPGGGTVTYSFTASKPGTYLYESGGGQRTSGGNSLYSSPQVQVRMGLFGALIVRPAGHPDWAYDRADSAFNPDTEFLLLLSEIDPYLNAKVLQGTAAYNMNNYKPRYWLINGRQFPDSIADNFASWLPSQPYGSLATIHPYDATLNPLPALDRYLSVGTVDYPFHPHGNNGKVIGRDGTPLANAAGDDMGFDKFAVNVGPGQTWDVLFNWEDAEDYSPSQPIPAEEPNLQDVTIGMFYSGSPYLGVQQELPPGVQTLNECGEFYIIAHNHALHQLTSWGVNMTGPITYTRVNPFPPDPPAPDPCQ